MPTKERLKKPWAKKESRKRQHEKTDVQLSEAMTNLNQSIAVHNKSATKEKPKMNEYELYTLSLANRLRNLDRMQKAIVRSSVEKVFLDIELGYSTSPTRKLHASGSSTRDSRYRQPEYVLGKSELVYFSFSFLTLYILQ